jgi:hypothetical protein
MYFICNIIAAFNNDGFVFISLLCAGHSLPKYNYIQLSGYFWITCSRSKMTISESEKRGRKVLMTTTTKCNQFSYPRNGWKKCFLYRFVIDVKHFALTCLLWDFFLHLRKWWIDGLIFRSRLNIFCFMLGHVMWWSWIFCGKITS